MISQTRDVLKTYQSRGGDVTEVKLEGTGHAPHLERPDEFRRALLLTIGYTGDRPDAPPTEAIVIRSAD